MPDKIDNGGAVCWFQADGFRGDIAAMKKLDAIAEFRQRSIFGVANSLARIHSISHHDIITEKKTAKSSRNQGFDASNPSRWLRRYLCASRTTPFTARLL
jgi:hypothetical protein